MAKCKRIRIAHRKYCAGDLRERITLQDRDIVEPFDINFTEEFTNPVVVPAAVQTVQGVSFFDDTNTEQFTTHDFIIRFRANVTTQTWILWQNVRYNIVLAEQIDGRNEWLKLRSTVRGIGALEVNRA